MSSLAELRDKVKVYLADLPQSTADRVDEFLRQAHLGIQNVHNWRVMETEFYVVVGAYGEIPPNHKIAEVESVKQVRAVPLLERPDGTFEELKWLASNSEMARISGVTGTGKPEYFLLDHPGTGSTGTIYGVPDPDGLSGWPDGGYRLRFPFWSYLPFPSTDDGTDWFFDQAETFLLFDALGSACIFNYDEAHAAVWLQRAQAELASLVKIDKRSRSHRSSCLKFRTDVYGDSGSGAWRL